MVWLADSDGQVMQRVHLRAARPGTLTELGLPVIVKPRESTVLSEIKRAGCSIDRNNTSIELRIGDHLFVYL